MKTHLNCLNLFGYFFLVSMMSYYILIYVILKLLIKLIMISLGQPGQIKESKISPFFSSLPGSVF